MAYEDAAIKTAPHWARAWILCLLFMCITLPISIAVYMWSPTAREEAHKFPPCCPAVKP